MSRLQKFKNKARAKQRQRMKRSDSTEEIPEVKEKMREIEKLKFILDERNDKIGRLQAFNVSLIKENKKIIDRVVGNNIQNPHRMVSEDVEIGV